MTDKNTLISSIFSKVKGKNAKQQNAFLQTIGSIKYKYTLFKAKDDGCYHKNYVGDFSYIDRPDNMTFHISDDEFGMFLYKVLKNKEFDFENTPNELKDVKFIAVNKLQKVVFVSLDITEENRYFLGDNYKDNIKVLENLYSIFNWFEENFIFEDKRLNVNYSIFFQYMFCGSNEFLCSLLRAFYIGESSYSLNKALLDSIIDMLLNYFDGFSLSNIRRNIEFNAKPFYQFVNQGIYMKDLDSDAELECLPACLRGNVLNYLVCKDYYDNLKDIFKRQSEYTAEEQNFIFNQELFKKSIKLREENEEFLIYENKDVKNIGYIPIFIKVKEKTRFNEFRQVVSLLINENLTSDTSIIYFPDEDSYYVCDYNDYSNQIKLCDYVKSLGNNQEGLSNFLLMFNNVFSGKAVIKQKVFIKEAETYLENLCVDKQTGEIKFVSIADISFSKEKGYTSFYYPLCMMQIVENFLSCNNMASDELYKCNFTKVFSQSFISSIIEYLNTKEYKDKGMIGKLKGTLAKEDESKVEFLENLDLTDECLLQRVSFIPNYKEMFVSISASVENAKKNIVDDKTTKHIELDEYMGFVTKNKDLCLSKKLIDKLTACPNTQNFLVPEKLVISKDVYDEKNYTVIGVIWGKNKLYSLSDLIESKEISTKNIYSSVISNIMRTYERNEIVVDKLKSGIGSLLLDEDYNIVIGCNSYTSIKDVTGINRSVNVYYTDIMRLIVKEYGDKLEKFTYFTDKQLFTDIENYTWENVFNRINFCDEHNRLYIQGRMCEECEELYVIADSNTSLEFQMGRYGGKYEYFNFNTNRILSNGIHENVDGVLWRANQDINSIAGHRVKVGLENGLYEKFSTLAPKKVVIKNYLNGTKVYGILLDSYDFSSMIEIDNFNYLQRMKVVLMLYKKILPLIEDGSFVATTASVFSTIFMDKTLKGEFILPNLPLVDTECIVYGTDKEKQEGKEKTLKRFSEFLYNYLVSDEGFRIEMKKKEPLLSMILQCIQTCNFKEKHIRAYLATKDAYCNVHGVHYASEDGICPECIGEGIERSNVLLLGKSYFNGLKSKGADFEGGEASLYFNNQGTIDKIFNDEVDLPFKSKVLGKALEKEKAFSKFNKEHSDIKFVSIYKLLYSLENGVLNLEGYRQEYIADAFKISSFKDKSFVEEKGYTKRDIIEILIKVCKGIEFLHSIGGFIGDLNGGNVLVKDKTVYFIDKDGMSFDDVKNCVYTNLYIYPPSAENKNITKEDDWYSLAIQAFYYLTYSHPFRGISNKTTVPKNELERMKHGYSVLGNHGINPPSVSIGWDLMPEQVVDFFINTFEGSKRENMLKTLEMYLRQLDKNEMDFREVIRQNEVAYALTENIYVDTQGILYFKEESRCTGIQEEKVEIFNDNVVLSNNKQTLIVNDKTGIAHVLDKSYESIKYVHDNRIYYTLKNDTQVYIDEFDFNSKTFTTHVLKRKTQNEVCAMHGYKNDKFVLLEQNNTNNTYEIYCNMIKICSLPQNEFKESARAGILHDEITDKWLVIIFCENNLRGIVIDKNGGHKQFDLYVEDEFDSAFDFYKNVLYFVGEKKIYMYSTSKDKLKSVYCSLSMPFINIKRKDNKLVIVNKKTYVYEKS